jgi:hypothetical protein
MTQDEESVNNARSLIAAVLNGDTLAKDEDGVVYNATAAENEGDGEGEGDGSGEI